MLKTDISAKFCENNRYKSFGVLITFFGHYYHVVKFSVCLPPQHPRRRVRLWDCRLQCWVTRNWHAVRSPPPARRFHPPVAPMTAARRAATATGDKCIHLTQIPWTCSCRLRRFKRLILPLNRRQFDKRIKQDLKYANIIRNQISFKL